MIDLKNKNIILTGATGGIGNSIIEKLNFNGANIIATGTVNDNKLATAPFSTGKAIAMSMVFG